jgi:hypothetical protein
VSPERVHHVVQRELGIGDILCSLYGLNGFSLALHRPSIVLHLQDHFEWIALVDIPNLSVASVKDAAPPEDSRLLGDTEAQYREKLNGAHDPKAWYARKLGVEPIRPGLNMRVFKEPAPFPSPYVVLAPFATRVNRTWEVHNWRLVAEQLAAAGYKVIALDAPGQPDRCRAIGTDYYWGQSPAWVGNVCRHAALIISGDSALAHLGGLLGTPTLVLLTQQIPERYYSMTANEFIVPDQPCTGCRFQPERGYEEKCDYGCWALQSIGPRAVIGKAQEMLSATSGP